MRFIQIITLIFLSNLSYLCYSQCSNFSVNSGTNADLNTETLYEETFAGQNGKGAIGNSIDLVGCTWTIDVSSAILSNTNDYFKVNSEKLEARDVDGICYWYSPIVNIQNYINVNLSLVASQMSNSNRYEEFDIFYSEYSLDGNVWTSFSTNGEMENGLPSSSVNVSQNGLKGSTVQIRVSMDVDEDNERFKLDNIKVTGQQYKINLCYGDPLSLGGSPTANWSGIGNPSITYNWTPTTALSDPNISNPIATPTVPTIYKVVSTLTNNGLICKDSSLFYVNVTPQVSVSSSSPVCSNDTLTISEHGGNATSWTWTSNGNATIISINDSSSQVVGMTDGEIFSVYVEDDDGCSNTTTATIQVNPKPTNVTSSDYGNYCSSSPIFPLTGGSPAGGYYSGVGVSNNNYDASSVGYGSSIENVDILYIYSDVNGCKDTSISQVTVQKAPDVELTSSFISLAPTNPNYIIRSPNGEWSKCGNPNPTFNLQLNISNSSVANNSANVNYDIDYGNGNNEINILPGIIYNNTYIEEGPYIITITATDNTTGCVREYKKNFFYGTNPAVSLGIPGNTQNQCSPKTYGFVASFSNNSGILNSPGTIYRKYTNDGKDDSTFIHPFPATDLLSDIIFHTFDEASCGFSSIAYDNSFLVGISATNGCGSSSAEVSPITQSSPPQAHIEMEDSIFCINSPVTFRDTSLGGKYVYGVNTGSGFSYECDTSTAVAWDFTPNTGFTVTSGSLGNYSGLQYFDGTTHGTAEIQVTFHNKGAYVVNFKKVSPCGNAEISDEDFKDFLIDSLPEAEFTLDKHIDCSPLFIYANNTSKSLDDFSSVFDWSYSTLTVGCQGSAPPNINPAASDSTVFEIYDEDFSGQNGQGAYGTSSDLSNVNWNILVNNSLWNNNDWFYVKNERFEAVNVSSNNNDTAYWYSSVVDISEYQYIFTELKAFTNNSIGTKSIKSQYKLDGGLWTDFLNNGVLTGNFTSPSIVSNDGINGNSIQLRVGINLSNSTDTIFFDDIEIYGYSIPDSLNTEYSFNLPGIYSIDLTATNVCGSDDFKDTVTAVGPPVLSIDNIIDTCDTKKLNPTATIDTCFGKMNAYNWSFPGSIANNISNLEIPSTILYDSVGVFKVYFNASNQCGLDSDSLEFEIHDNPVISMKELDSVCFGLSLGISASVSEGSPNYSYLWSSVNASISNSTIPNPVVTTTIDNNVFLEVTDVNNCEAYDTIFVDVLDLPSVNTGQNQSVCPEDTAFLFGSISGAIPPYTFSWNSNFLSDQTILNPYYDMNGTETFTLTATDSFGCTNNSSVIINERISPLVNAGQDTALCDQPIAVDFNGSPNGGTWVGNKINNAGLFSPNGIVQDTAIYQYTDSFGCYNEDTLLIDVQATVLANAGIDFEKCISEQEVYLSGIPSGGNWDHPNMISNSVTLYNEDFTGQNNKGFSSFTSYDTSNINWSLDVNGMNYLNRWYSYFKVQSGYLEARYTRTNGAYWYSPKIAITNHINVTISFDASENANLYPTDSLVSQYRTDGGVWKYFNSNGQLNSNFSSVQVSHNNIFGDTLEFRVKFKGTISTSSRHRIDNILVIGDQSGIFDVTVADTFALPYIYGSGNCVNNDTVNLVINPLPVVDPGNDFESCIDNADELLVPSVPGGIWSGNGITNPNGTFTPSNAGAGIHNLNYYYRDSNTCEITDSLKATVYSLPVVFTQLDTVICDLPVDVTLNASPTGGNWIDTNITNNGIYSPDGPGSFKIYYEYTDVNTCYNIDSIILTVNPAQIANAGPDIIACADTGLIILNGLPSTTGIWDGNGVDLVGNYNSNPANLNIINENFAYNIGSGNCFTTDTMNLLINPLPVISLDNSFEICISVGDTTIQFSPSGGLLEGTGVLNSNNGLFSPTDAGVGTHKLIYSYENPITGCWNFDSLEITVNPLPKVNYIHDSIFCLNVGYQLNNSTTEVQNHYWNISEGSFSNSYSPVFSIDTAGIFDINYIAETNRGCLDSARSIVEVLAPPLADYSAPDSGCGPLQVDFTNNSIGKYVSYLWDFGLVNNLGNDSISNDTTPVNHSYPAGIYFDTTYYTSLTVTNYCGVSLKNLEIISMPSPVSRFASLSNVGGCGTSLITLANNSYGLPDYYYWDFGDGSFGTNSDTIFDKQYSPGPSTDFYTITMAVTNECGTDTTIETVTILPSGLVAFFSVDTTVGCLPFTLDFEQFSVGAATHSWDFNDGNFSNTYSPTHTFLDTGTFEVSLAVSNACDFDTAFKTIRVNTSPNVEFSVIDDTLCAGSTLLISNSSDLGINNNWNFGDNTTSFLTNPTHVFLDSGHYRVILTGTSLTNNCPASDSVDLVVLPYPEVTASSDTSNGCIPLPVNFSSIANSVGYYLWDFGDGNTSGLANPNHTYTSDGYYSVNLRFEDLAGCVDSFDFDIIPYPVPQISFNPIQLDTCVLPASYTLQNNSIGASTNNWDFGDGSVSFINSPNYSYNSPGSYDINLLISNTYGCSDSTSQSIVVKPVPIADFNPIQLDTCILPVNYNLVNNSQGATAYSWNFGDGNSSNLVNLNHSYNQDGNYQISLIAMNSVGCFDTSQISINILPVPQTSFNAIQLDTCVLPASYTLQNNSIGASTNNWDFGDGSVSFINSPNHPYTLPGSYDISLMTSNSYGCSDSSTQSIVINPVPISNFNPIQLDTCILPVNYNLVNNSQGAIAYTWDFGDGNSSNLANLNHSYNQDGNYQISLIALNSVGCFDTSQISINILPVPDLSFNYNQRDTCTIPSLFSFQNNSNGATSYLWDFGDGLYSSLSSPFHSFNNAGTYNVQLSSTNIYGCSDTFINPVTINPVPIAQFNAFQLDTCVLPANYSLVNNSIGSFINSWDLGDGSNSNSLNLNYAYLNSGTYNITLTTTNQFGCLDTSSKTVNVLPVPYSDFTYNKLDSCILPSNYSFTNNSTGSNSYIWSFDTIANSIQPNPFFTFNSDGVFEIKLLSINNSGCVDSSINYINVSPIISADFTTDTSIGCEPFNVIFNNNSQNSSFYNWDFGDGNTASFFNGFYEYQNAGNYIIKLVAEDINGCKDSIFEPINVYPSPTSSYTYIASDPCYLPISVDFTNTSLLSNNFEWNFGNGQTSSINNPSIIFDSVGNYNIQLISGNSYNCYDTLNNFFDVVNKQVPIANFNFNDSICLRDTTFFNSTTLFADSLVWNLGNGIISYGDAISYVYDSSGQYTITLFAYNTVSGCSDTLQSSNFLDVLSSPVADFNFNQIQSDEPLSGSLEFINNSTAADSYFWDFSNIDSTSEEYPIYYYSYDFDGTYYYTLYAFNNYGCVDSLTKDLYIFYKKTLFIPNALYPSSNKFEVANFIPKGTGMKKYKIEIFDLYGNLIWESSSLDDEGQPTEYWDGKFNGQDVETDIYIWKVEAQFKDDSFWEGQKPIEENILRKTGSLTVIR